MKSTILLLLLAIAITSCNKSTTPTLPSDMYIIKADTTNDFGVGGYSHAHIHVSAGYPVDSVTIYVYGGDFTKGFRPSPKIVNGGFVSDLPYRFGVRAFIRYTQYPSMKQITFPTVK